MKDVHQELKKNIVRIFGEYLKDLKISVIQLSDMNFLVCIYPTKGSIKSYLTETRLFRKSFNSEMDVLIGIKVFLFESSYEMEIKKGYLLYNITPDDITLTYNEIGPE